MGKSIMQDDRRCYFCGRLSPLERHHVFAGCANRPISEREGLWVWLCHEDHTGKYGAQYNKEKRMQLEQDAQYAYEKKHSRSEWMKLFGKNYLGTPEEG